MLRRSTLLLLLNISGESPSFRSKPVRNLQMDVLMSPYKEQFKDYWATPVPFADREYGKKPKLGDPVPTRRAVTTIVVGKNNHINDSERDRERFESGEDNDYKVLMLYREGKSRLTKDQVVFPSLPVAGPDTSEDWDSILRRRGLTTQWDDLHERLAAHRALLASANILVIPKEGGGIAEVEGPPGPKKWHLLVHSSPVMMRNLIDILELPMETVLSQFLPFRRVVSPVSETFRFDNKSFLIPFEKIPDVRFTISTIGERLVWVSPREAIERFNAGILNMPTPNLIVLSELNNEFPLFDEIVRKKSPTDTPRPIQPTLYRHADTKVATVLLPGDMQHPSTTPEDRALKYVRRFVYEKDYPFGVRAVFDERLATVEEENEEELVPEPPKLLEEATEIDMLYADVPYPQRTKSPAQIGKTRVPLPQYRFQEGKENEEGIIPVREDQMLYSPQKSPRKLTQNTATATDMYTTSQE